MVGAWQRLQPAPLSMRSRSGQATTKAHPKKSIETFVKLPAPLDARLSERRYWEPRDCKVDECYSALSRVLLNLPDLLFELRLPVLKLC